MEALCKDKIEAFIVPWLSKGKRGSKVGLEVWQIVWAIMYRLKSGCQWRMLPVGLFFEHKAISLQGVYYHFRRWVCDGAFKQVWVELLKQNP